MKRVFNCIYAHKSAAFEAFPEKEYLQAYEIITRYHHPNWDYIKYNTKTRVFTFTWCRGWHELSEPVVARQVQVDVEAGKTKPLVGRKNPPIIHGKHLFAGTRHPEGVGFDIEAARKRWESYQGADWLDKSRMGFLNWWNENAVPRIGR